MSFVKFSVIATPPPPGLPKNCQSEDTMVCVLETPALKGTLVIVLYEGTQCNIHSECSYLHVCRQC
jgi:hypothetical protein